MYKIITIREKLLSANEKTKKQLTRQFTRLEKEDEAYLSRHQRLEKALNEIADELEILRKDIFEWDEKLPILIESRKAIFHQLLSPSNAHQNEETVLNNGKK